MILKMVAWPFYLCLICSITSIQILSMKGILYQIYIMENIEHCSILIKFNEIIMYAMKSDWVLQTGTGYRD